MHTNQMDFSEVERKKSSEIINSAAISLMLGTIFSQKETGIF